MLWLELWVPSATAWVDKVWLRPYYYSSSKKIMAYHFVTTHGFLLPPQYKADTLKTNRSLTEEHPWIDYTSPSLITLLFTDLGVLTPSAVSDELIKLYL